jgi:hypothetical protein
VITRKLPEKRLLLLCRFFGALCVLAAVWAAALTFTGGFFVRFGPIRISSQHPRNAVLISLLSAVVVWALSWSREGRKALRDEWSRWRRRFDSTQAVRTRWWPVIRYAASAITIAAVGIALDIHQWNVGLPLWVDEEMIALNVRDRSVLDLGGPLWLGQSAPFGWLVLERTAMLMAGHGERALRFVPLLFGIATIATAVWVGRRWMGHIAAMVFVLLCWISQSLSHYRVEIKHYSADAFFALLIPALAVRTIEANSRRDRARRGLIWWGAAAVSHWFANGALLVTPACALLLFGGIWRRDGRRAAVLFSVAGLVWLISFGLHYQLSIRYTHNSPYLRSQWATELLPLSLGLTGALRWLINRLEPLANDPGGTTLWLSLWTSAICGFVFRARGSVGPLLASVPLSAFAFAALVPLHQRFSIWIVPALYAGVACLIDTAIGLGRYAFAHRRWALLALAVVVLFVEFRLCADIFERGRTGLEGRLHAHDKQQLDDRVAVRWLMSQWEPGDVLMTTPLALPAVWWYAAIPLSDAAGTGGFLQDGSPVYEVWHTHDCPSPGLGNTLKERRRVLLYLGFDVEPEFDDALLHNLGQLGDVTRYREFSALGRAALVDLRAPPSHNIMRLSRRATNQPRDLDGCLSVRLARRW